MNIGMPMVSGKAASLIRPNASSNSLLTSLLRSYSVPTLDISKSLRRQNSIMLLLSEMPVVWGSYSNDNTGTWADGCDEHRDLRRLVSKLRAIGPYGHRKLGRRLDGGAINQLHMGQYLALIYTQPYKQVCTRRDFVVTGFSFSVLSLKFFTSLQSWHCVALHPNTMLSASS